jgi:hypothetical protein
MIAQNEIGEDGGINPALTIPGSDVCVSGMFLNYASYFRIDQELLRSVIDSILALRMKDGGFNCELNYRGAVHSSLHSTLSVFEGLSEYKKNGYGYRLTETGSAEKTCAEFILRHQFFLSDRTGRIIRKDFLKLSYPGRWKYDILRALDHFRYADLEWDDRMQPAVDVLLKKRNKDRTWNLQAHHPGKRHFDMEEVGKPSRWNTLRATRVLKHFGID